jgi:hypothetical protein
MSSYQESYVEAEKKWPNRGEAYWSNYARVQAASGQDNEVDGDTYDQEYEVARTRWPNRGEAYWSNYAKQKAGGAQ